MFHYCSNVVLFLINSIITIIMLLFCLLKNIKRTLHQNMLHNMANMCRFLLLYRYFTGDGSIHNTIDYKTSVCQITKILKTKTHNGFF